MAVTVVVLSGGEPGSLPGSASLPDPSLTLDSPRLVIGRGEGCDVRLPDPSVSHRHASLRQRGGEYVILDENSQNGTFLSKVRLPPQTPRVIRSGERVRLGRVWLEVRIEPAVVKGSTAAAAKELALTLVTRGLSSQGEDPSPRLVVLEGPDAGATIVLDRADRTYVVGRDAGADLLLHDSAAGRRHASVIRKGDALLLRDGGSNVGIALDGVRVAEATWKPGQVLTLGATAIAYEHPAAEALAEIERSPDELMPAGEAPEPPRAEPSAPAEDDAAAPPDPEATPEPAPSAGSRPASRSRKPAEGGWGTADALVVFLALGVLALSALGAVWLLGR